MPTLFYSPMCRILIEVQRASGEYVTIDVSDDNSDGDVALNENQPHSVQFTLINHRRKYDNLFTPNDRIVIQMRRINWLQVFAGYLSQVPLFSAHQRSITLTAECTLKRLRFFPFDPGSVAWTELLNRFQATPDPQTGQVSAAPGGQALPGGAGPAPNNPQAPGTTGTSTTPTGGQAGTGTGTGGTDSGSGGTKPTQPDGNVPTKDSQGNTVTTDRDGGMAAKMKAILTEVVGWGEGGIHISKIPDAWLEEVDTLYKELGPAYSESVEKLGGNADVGAGGAPGGLPGAPVPGGASAPSTTTPDASAPGASAPGSGAAPATPTPDSAAPATAPTGLVFKSENNLDPNVNAALQFIKANYVGKEGVVVTSTYRGPGSGPHAGHAIDISGPCTNDVVNDKPREVLTSLAMWMMHNPKAFGLSQVIWQKRYSSGGAWSEITAAQLGSFGNYHTNHLHLGFQAPGAASMTELGPMGSPWPNSNVTDVDPGHPIAADILATGAGAGGGGGGDGSGGHTPTFMDQGSWFSDRDPVSDILTGPRLLLNDKQEILPEIATACHASMRSFASAPNGDFIAWFPDYFGLYGTAGRVRVELIELEDFTIQWTDENMKTHQFVVGADPGYGPDNATGEQAINQFITHGIASVEQPKILQTLMGIKDGDPIWGDPQKIFDRFGARPYTQPFSETQMFTTRSMEFWAALWYFQKNWAEQFSADIPITFMPELFPGMILEIPVLKFQAYVTSVRHSWDFQEGGGFKTTASVIAPSTTDAKGFRGMVIGKSDDTKVEAIQANPLGTPLTQGGDSNQVPPIAATSRPAGVNT